MPANTMPTGYTYAEMTGTDMSNNIMSSFEQTNCDKMYNLGTPNTNLHQIVTPDENTGEVDYTKSEIVD